MQRIIAHIDLNSFFASCEQQDTPSWRGLPVGVCEHLGGIIIAPSVEAKVWKVKTGTPVWEAKTLCPHIVLTKTNPDRYRFYAAKFFALLAEYTNRMERYSIDEAFLDLTLACNIKVRHKDQKGKTLVTWADPFVEAERIVKEIKQRLQAEVGDWLRCSAGIAWNKLVAKIASDMKKPDGLVVVRPENKLELYNHLSLTDIPGIARRQSQRLLKYGIRTLRDLRDCPQSHLVAWFGIPGRHLWYMGQLEGFYGEGFLTQPQKSIGHMYTIAREHRKSSNVAVRVLARLSELVARRLRSLKLVAGGVSVFVLGSEEEVVGGHMSLGEGVNSGSELLKAIEAILKQYASLPEDVIRVGVTAYNLEPAVLRKGLFSVVNKTEQLARALDAVNTKYSGAYDWDFAKTSASLGNVPGLRGQDVLLPGTAFFARDIIRDSVGFGRVRELGS